MSYPPPQNSPQEPPYWQQPPGQQQQYGAPMPPYMTGPQAMHYGQPPLPLRKKRKKLPFILGGIGAVFLLCIGGSVIAAASDGSMKKSFDQGVAEGAAVGGGKTTAPTTPATQQKTTVPAKPADVVPATAVPVATTKAPTANFTSLSTHDWALIVKDPDGHAGQMIVVYGVVTQFDGATGTGLFLANAGPTKNASDVDASTIFTGDANALNDLVEGDSFKAEAVIVGSQSYDTQDGGNTTVPDLKVVSIKTF